MQKISEPEVLGVGAFFPVMAHTRIHGGFAVESIREALEVRHDRAAQEAFVVERLFGRKQFLAAEKLLHQPGKGALKTLG